MLEHHVRYEMHWGHKVTGKDGDVEVTRAEFNIAFGAENKTPDVPEVPDIVEHVWTWWWQLNSRRAPGFDAMAPITYSEIYHWSTLTRTQITPNEINMLIQMDDAYIQAVNVERKEQRDRK